MFSVESFEMHLNKSLMTEKVEKIPKKANENLIYEDAIQSPIKQEYRLVKHIRKSSYGTVWEA